MCVCVRKNSKYISRILFSKSGSVSDEFFYKKNGFVSNKNLINSKMKKKNSTEKKNDNGSSRTHYRFSLETGQPKESQSLNHEDVEDSMILCDFFCVRVCKQIVCFWGATFPVLIHFFGQHKLCRKSSVLTSKINFNLIAASHKQTRKKLPH